jgi:hypothetical protein
MVRHFGQFQHMWDRRESNQEPFLEWWTQFKAWIRDCIDKVRASNNKLQHAKYQAYRDNTQGFYDSPAFDWPTLITDTTAR